MLMIARGALRVSPEVKVLPLINLCSKQLIIVSSKNWSQARLILNVILIFLGFPHDHKLIKQDKNHILILNFVYRDNHYLTDSMSLNPKLDS